MFLKRLISGIVLLGIAFAGIYFGGWFLWAIVLLLALTGTYEMYKALGVKDIAMSVFGYITIGSFFLIIMPIVSDEKRLMLGAGVFVLDFLISMAGYVFTFPKYTYKQVFDVIIGAIYPGILISFLYLIRISDCGMLMCWMVFIAAWGSDTFAYLTGMTFKKLYKVHQMTPKLSPKKSIEGGIGGLFFAGLIGFLFGLGFQKDIMIFDIYTPVACALIAVFGGMISMVGDLAASAIKRNVWIKDYGNVIPGHGGVMDRFDSIIFAAPCIYYLIIILQMF